MATEYSAHLTMQLISDETLDALVDPGSSGSLVSNVVNVNGGRRWTTGQASGMVDAAYKRLRTIGSGATDSYDLLAAGSLTTPSGAAIDLDELKGLVLKVTSGQIKLVANATNGVGCFTAASEGLQLNAVAGLRAVALDFGPDGLDVATNSKFNIVETSASATAAYELTFIGAE